MASDYRAAWRKGAGASDSSPGGLVFDSRDDFEQVTAEVLPEDFKSNNEANDSFDNRSDNKGPEPEGIEIGEVGSRTYAFIGLERVGGVMIYDIRNPRNPRFVEYANNAPEGLPRVSSSSPTPVARMASRYLVVANEVSGSTTIYEVRGGRIR